MQTVACAISRFNGKTTNHRKQVKPKEMEVVAPYKDSLRAECGCLRIRALPITTASRASRPENATNGQPRTGSMSTSIPGLSGGCQIQDFMSLIMRHASPPKTPV